MARSIALLATVSGLILAICCVIAAVCMEDHGPVYSVAELRAQLAHDPRGWVGRTVRVRGRATACAIRIDRGYFRCMPRQPRLDDPSTDATTEPLLLAWADPGPVLTAMRRVPLLGNLLPAPQQVDWGAVVTYRVQLRTATRGSCGGTACYEALVLDAAP